jgi:hypothetical protein
LFAAPPPGDATGNVVDYHQALGSAVVSASAFVGGADDAYVYDATVNQVSVFNNATTGWHRIVSAAPVAHRGSQPLCTLGALP